MNSDKIIAVRTNKTIYRDGDKCIKVFNSDYSKADILNEALNQARIEETGLNIPKILAVETIDGKWSIVSEYIEGETLASLMEKNPDKEDEYLELLVDLQMECFSDSLTSRQTVSTFFAVSFCPSLGSSACAASFRAAFSAFRIAFFARFFFGGYR